MIRVKKFRKNGDFEENIKNGSDPNDLIKEMEKAGFSPSQVRPFVFSIEIDKNTIEIDKLKYRDFENTGYFYITVYNTERC